MSEPTGIFATKEEKERLNKLATQARETPDTEHEGTNHRHAAWWHAMQECHKVALSHGLPDGVIGCYGIDGKTGEFLAPGNQPKREKKEKKEKKKGKE
jgi:hypothetical protein